MPETATYVYCLVEQQRPPSMAKVPRGLSGAATPTVVEVGASLWGVLADVPLLEYGPDRLEERLRNIGWVADIAIAHESVVEHFAAAKRATVVPMKLFTMFSSRERAIADLRTRRKDVLALLGRIRGCQEWGLRVTARPIAPRKRASPAPAPSTGAAFLAAKKQARDDARERGLKAVEAAESVYEALLKLAKHAHRRAAPEGSTTPPLLDAAFLVSTSKRARFKATTVRLAAACRKAGAMLVLTGPWPAYNFVSLDGGES